MVAPDLHQHGIVVAPAPQGDEDREEGDRAVEEEHLADGER